ncbi:hypothetical protein GCM10025863_32120 [Microbacterium suwonense]|uniref:Uncharacterized protein n=1 Tax=Microbacterium suwonense TaxID=683047 RepID=A0ABN6XAX3_9MICO|nr:hypothetical protein GCM10025863_32120 [Microbacterium suwonense]
MCPSPSAAGSRAEPARCAPARAGRGAAVAPAPTEPTPEEQAALIDLTGRLRSTLAFYLDREDGRAIDVAWVAGAGTRHGRLRDVLTRIVGVDVAPLTALDVVDAKGPLEPGLNTRLLSTVALTIGGRR